MVMIEDYYDEFLRNQGYGGKSSNKIIISKEEYNKYKNMAKKYKLISEELEEIKGKNIELEHQVEALKVNEEKINELTKEVELYGHNLKQVRADYQNFKRITERENESYKKFVLEGFLRKLINHYDDLKRGYNILETLENGESLKKGFEMMIKNFDKILKEEGLREIESEGKQFDPYKHETLMTEYDDAIPENTIIEELEKGYYYKEKILRPAKVKISKHHDNQSKNNKINENKKNTNSN